MADLAAAERHVALQERKVTPAEAGRPLSAIATGLGVRVYRDGRIIGFWEPDAAALQVGDTILEIVPRPARQAAS